MSDSASEEAMRPQVFSLLYDTLANYNERFVKASMSVTTAILVVIGWLLTANSVQQLFSSSLALTLAAMLVIAALMVVYTVSMRRVYDVNQKVFRQLLKLDYIGEEFYSHHRLPASYRHFGLWVNIGLYLLLALLIANEHWGC